MTVPYPKLIPTPTDDTISRIFRLIADSTYAKQNPLGALALTRRAYGLGWVAFSAKPDPARPISRPICYNPFNIRLEPLYPNPC
jgi:hypothetical protein